MRYLLKYLAIGLIAAGLMSIMSACERQKPGFAQDPGTEIQLTVRFDAKTFCPANTDCTEMSVRPDGSVDYSRPIVMHLLAEDPLGCLQHEFSHVLRGTWHKGRQVRCEDF